MKTQTIIVLCTIFAATLADKITLAGTIRDFGENQPDFGTYCCGLSYGLVKSTLGTDRLPQFNQVGNPQYLTSAAVFYDWFHDVSGVNINIPTSIELSNDPSNPDVYTYINSEYFPIDGQGWGNNFNGHNFYFTLEIHTVFTYKGGEVFYFTGDDDVWVFINNQLVVDLGGVHGPADGSVSLDTLGLTVGHDYPFDFFFAERHCCGSNLKITTSIRLQSNVQTCQINGTFRTQSEGDWGDKCSEGFASGCFRDQYFAQCFPEGLTLGCQCDNSQIPSKRTDTQCQGHVMSFSSSLIVEEYLPQLGRPASLDRDYVDPINDNNPVSTSSGNFGGQLTALALSLGFDSCLPDFGTDCNYTLSELYICDQREHCSRTGSCKRWNTPIDTGKPKFPNCKPFYGWTVQQVFDAANKALGGCCTSSGVECDPVALNECITLINQDFIFGKTLEEIHPAGIFSETACPSTSIGCSDGQREGFTDLTAYPCIAACAASWSIPGVVGKAKNCGGQSGDDIVTPPNVACSVADACAPGWHVCATSGDVGDSLNGGSCSDAGQGFYVSQQSGGGCGVCALGGSSCTPGTCSSSCAFDQNMRNDIFGCGDTGIAPDSSCYPLNKFGNNECASLPSPLWNCNDHSNGFFEADNAVKTNTAGGGVLCCKDSCTVSPAK